MEDINIQYLPKEEKKNIKVYQRKRYPQLIQYKKEALHKKQVFFLLSIRMNEKTLKFDNIRVNKKEFHKSKQPIDLDLVNVNQIVVPDKLKHSDDDFKCFNGYKKVKLVNRCVLSYLK